MKWSHLPVAGGIYDQHPKLLEDWMVIFQAKAKKEAADAAKRQAELDRQARAQQRAGASARRRR